MKRLACIACVGCGLAATAQAASFDCAKAQRPLEKLICASPKLNAADERMGETYGAGLRQLPAADVGLLRADQVQWLAWMQETCHAPEPGAPPQRKEASAVTACMLPLYAGRTKQLRSIVTGRDGMRFLQRTQYLALPDDQVKEHPDWPEFGMLTASWPTALSDAPEWTAWNTAMEKAAYRLAAEDVWSIGKRAAPQPDWAPSLAAQADTEVSVLVRRVEHGRVTSALSRETMGHGAAHPSETSQTSTWLLRERRTLRPDDVFQPGDAWKRLVAEACWHAIHTGDKRSYVYPQVTGPDAKAIQDVIADVGNWTLEHDGLHISYPEYAVDPRYAGMDDTVIAWTALQPVLASGFVAP